MALFRTLSAPEPLAPINGEGVVMRGPQMADFTAWAELREASRKFLTPWEPTWPSDDLTRPAFRQRLRRYAEDMRTDQAYPFFLFRTEDNALIGGLALANIRRGVAQAGSLGYWVGAALRPERLYDRGGAGARSRRRSTCCGCTGWKRPASRPILPRCASWRKPASGARAMPGPTCASMGHGRTICCTRGCKTTPEPEARRQFRLSGRCQASWSALGPPRSLCYKCR